ncbi:MAG TPA: UDP-N-acetylglucosamine--N-acetylmuramyl-(pentapeptide) pyrophosphoryl-undecaprenol N-acetylglucosamine transferase [Pirellulales bacterium]|nr:UDP-N-acetylglucosamine--N-acetylmuramyl-(pentapeptide) pyrophosphoryl-undecaprenol N-acetylglucosamine transferase [Pirellulales bacterium]
MSSPCIVFTGGGTLGHLFAGMAVAEALREIAPDSDIHFVGRGSANEGQHVTSAGYQYHCVPCHPWPRRLWNAPRFLTANLRGFAIARRLLDRLGADVVVGLGGYSSAPVARAAVSRQIPLVLLEQNAVPGRVTRWLSRHASCVCTSFAASGLRCRRIFQTGNPVRSDFAGHRLAVPREKLLVITGGSLGAAALNAAVPQALGYLKRLVDGWRIVHQAGERELHSTIERYRRCAIAAEVTAFADLASLLPRAGLAVCRAGGSTIAELQVSGTPAILCPYPHASDDHQRHNAAALGDACRVVEQTPPGFAERLADELALALSDERLRAEMSRAMIRRSRPGAARDVASLIERENFALTTH